MNPTAANRTEPRYADLPMPADWLPVLSGYRPAAPRHTETLDGGHLRDLFDALLGMLQERERDVLYRRVCLNETVESLSASLRLTRERVRQLITTATRGVQRQGLNAQFSPLAQTARTAEIFRISAAESRLVPGANEEQMWALLFSMWRERVTEALRSTRLPGGTWLLTDAESLRSLQRARDSAGPAGTFHRAEDLASVLNIRLSLLQHGHSPDPDLILTENGHAGFHSWTTTQWMTAVAEVLAGHSADDWHFSELTRALEFVRSGTTSKCSGATVRLALSGGNGTLFEQVGVHGRWRLNTHGDGHRNNHQAVTAILQAAGTPLHINEIMARLQPTRKASRGTLLALLAREAGAAFTRHGPGTYGLIAPQQGGHRMD